MPRSPQQIADYREKLDRFAELLSQDISIYLIAPRMGISTNNAKTLMRALRHKYGWQAA